jgi:AbrB family looped-hinge helix DNA binding protein
MRITMDKAGRVVIPAKVRKRLELSAGTEIEMAVDGFAIRLVRAVAGPRLVRRGERLVARPQAKESERAEVHVAQLIEEERDLVAFRQELLDGISALSGLQIDSIR